MVDRYNEIVSEIQLHRNIRELADPNNETNTQLKSIRWELEQLHKLLFDCLWVLITFSSCVVVALIFMICTMI